MRRRRSRRARRDKVVIERLRLRNRSQREFLAFVSHEVRTPLMGILGGIELLGHHQADLGRHATVLDAIEASATHLRDLLSDVLDLSSAEAGRMQVALQPVSVARVCSQAVKLVDALARSKRIAIEMEIDDSLDCVRADPGRLRQILSNVLNNAVKFTPEAGRVGVRATLGGSFAVFEVWDGGPGLSPEQVKRLSAFEPYTRLMSSPDTPSGAGLGLAIVKRLVDLHAGRLSIHSAPGEGSRFRIEIPLASSRCMLDWSVDEGTGKQRSIAGRLAPAAPGIRVLLLDDVATNVMIASKYLRQAGFEVITADSAQRALDILRRSSVDVLVCDVCMPDMDGVALAKLVRCDPRFANLPIIALTGSDNWLERRRCLEAGMQEFLLKPLALRDLASSIVRHCRARFDGCMPAQAAPAQLECCVDESSPPSATAGVLHDINDALGAAIGNLDLALSAEDVCDRAMLRDAFDSCRRVAELLRELPSPQPLSQSVQTGDMGNTRSRT